MEIDYLERNRKFSLKIYALVSQLVVMLVVMTLGGYLLGRYVFFKTAVAAGIFATIGAIGGIIYFIYQVISIGKKEEASGDEN